MEFFQEYVQFKMFLPYARGVKSNVNAASPDSVG